MKIVVLPTTEAEYMALSEVVKELKFIVQLLQTMNIEVELPITVHVDNVGAICYLTIVQQVTEPNILTSEHHLSKNIKKMEKSSSNL